VTRNGEGIERDHGEDAAEIPPRAAAARALPDHPLVPNLHVGAKVTIVIDSSVQKGWPHHRFHGMTGTVVGRRGNAFLVDVRFGGRIKQAVVRPEHLRRA